MPEFQMDTSGTIHDVRAPSIEAVKRVDLDWTDLDAFTQGYIEAMFFTSTGNIEDGDLQSATFSELAPETLAAIVADCAEFQAETYEPQLYLFQSGDIEGEWDEARAGRDFWYTRNGHGVGFWDGDRPEPHATALTAAARTFRGIYLYRGDDGRLYLA